MDKSCWNILNAKCLRSRPIEGCITACGLVIRGENSDIGVIAPWGASSRSQRVFLKVRLNVYRHWLVIDCRRVLVWKLNDILGTQQGHVQEFKPDAPASPSNDAPALQDDRPAVAPESRHQKLGDDKIAADKEADAILSAVSDIAAADRYFDPEGFLWAQNRRLI